MQEKKSYSFFSILKRLLAPVNVMPCVFLRAMLFPVISAFITVVSVEFMKRIIDNIQQDMIGQVEIYFWWFIWIIIVWLVCRYITKYRWYAELWPAMIHYLTERYLRKYIVLDNNQIENIWTGRLVTIIEQWIMSWIDLMWRIIIGMTKHLSKIFFSLVLIFAIDIRYGIILFLLLIIIISVYVKTQNFANKERRGRKYLHVEYMGHMVKMIMSKFEVLQSWNIGRDFVSYPTMFSQWYNHNKRIENMRFIGEGFAVLIVDGLKIFAIGLLLYGRWWWNITIGEFMAIITLLILLDQIVWDMSYFYIDACKEYIHIEKMWNMFDTVPNLSWYLEGEDIHIMKGDIFLENISYAYDTQNVFDNFSLDIVGWKKTALVWISGSGKSTLVKLIAWYLHPNLWNIRIDGQNLTDVSLKSYYKYVWYLTQEPMVFDGTILENLTYALDESQSDIQQKIDQAITSANCEFLYNFPQWLETEIGERWIRLSGGQRQRLAIAKIFLKDPKILILDEPTSALDSFSEEAITQAMHSLFAWRTVIIIAHRLQTVKAADDIILLEEGKVVERWTHDELVEKWWQYAKMLELQSGF